MTGLFSAVGNENDRGTRFFRGDEFLNFLRINPTDVGWMKIDVEGFEMNVIRGFSNTLEKTKAVLEIEINKNTMMLSKFRLSEIFEYMEKYSYSAYVDITVKEKFHNKNAYCDDAFDIYFIKSTIKQYLSVKFNFFEITKKECLEWDKKYLDIN